MAQTTTNYGLLKPESTDSYNHLIYDNPNMDTIDAAMKANSDAAITSATCIKSGTTHTITRSNTSAGVMRFTATGDWNSGDTMIIDGVTVSPYLTTGEALKTGAYLINSEVIVALSGTRATVLSNQSEAGTTYFDDSTVTFTASNVQDAIEAVEDLAINPVITTTGLSPLGGSTILGFKGAKQGGMITVSAVIQPVFSNYNALQIGTLPAGYRPSSAVRTAACNTTKDTQVNVIIDSNGVIEAFPTADNVNLAAQNLAILATFV